MSKRKKVCLGFITTIILAIISVIAYMGIVYGKAISSDNLEDDFELAKYAEDYGKDFVTTSVSKLIGKKLKINLDKGTTINKFAWAVCVDPHTFTPAEKQGKPYRILQVIDIARDSPTSLTVYKAKTKNNGNDTKVGEYTTHKITKKSSKIAALRIVKYTALKSNRSPIPDAIWREYAMITQQNKSAFIDSAEVPSSKCSADSVEKYETSNADVKAAKDYAKKHIDDKENKKIEKVDTTITTIPVYNKKGKLSYTLIGPFKAKWTGGSVKLKAFKTYDANGKELSNNAQITNKSGKKIKIKSNKDFYIKLTKTLPDGCTSWSLKLKHTYNDNYKARLVILGNPKTSKYSAQNLGILGVYRGKNTATVTWGPSTENKLIINKQDEKGNPIDTVGFKVKYNGAYVNSNYGWGSYTVDIDGAVVFYTSSGKIELNNLPEGYYQAEEVSISNPNYSVNAQRDDRFTEQEYVSENQEEDVILSLTLTNKQYTNLRIRKIVQDSNTAIAGVTFKIQYYDEEYQDVIYDSINNQWKPTGIKGKWRWIQSYTYGQPSSITYTDDENAAAEFVTPTSGNLDFYNIPVGNYKAKEVSIPADLPYGKDPSWVDNISSPIYCGPINDTNWNIIANERTFVCENPWFIKISGYVYSPEKGGKDEQSVLANRNGNYDASSDYVVANAKVKLLKNGQEYTLDTNNGESGSSTTDSKGFYEYTVRISNEADVNNFSIKFEYDGMDFLAMTPNYIDTTIPNENLATGATSKATEDTTKRNELNKAYSEIKGTPNADLQKGYADTTELNYDFTKQEGDGQGTTGTSRSEVKDFKTGYDENKEAKIRTIKSNTVTKNNISAVYNLSGAGTTNNQYNYSNYCIRTDSTSSNPNVLKKVIQLNLGIMLREQPDLSLTNKIVGVNADINGFTNKYKTTLSRQKSKNETLNVGVTYVNEGELAKFKIYPSDVKTIAEAEKDSELKLYVTYGIDIINNSQTLYSKVNELAIFYDPNYTLESIGTTVNEANKASGDIQKSDNSSKRTVGLKEIKMSEELTYNTAYIDTSSLIITPKDYVTESNPNYKTIYVTYRVSRNELKRMLSQNGYVPQYKNIAEINSYSTYSDEGTTLYAGIDKNSAPGNIPTIIDTREIERKDITSMFDNDTGYAEEFRIDVREEDRSISGQVFLDSSETGGKGNERTSNGIYEDGKDQKLSKVNVTLQEIEVDDNNNIQFDETGIVKPRTSKMQEDIIVETTENGIYTISGFIPGNYILKYEYNNETYYMNAEGNPININALDYKSAVISSENINYHAGEDYTKTTNMTKNPRWYLADNPKTTDIPDTTNYTKYTEALDNWNTRQKLDYKEITYETTDAGYNINAPMDAYTPTFAINVELNTLSEGNQYLPEGYKIDNMDFGITERAKQEMTIDKKVSNIKITLANGQVLLDGDPKTNKKMSGLKYIAPSEVNKKGTVNIELDSELIHGSTLEITYLVTVNNNSEIDYYTPDYYKYGTNKYKVVTITPQVYDYVDNNLTFDKDKNKEWEVIPTNQFTANKDASKLQVSSEAINNINKINTIVHYNGTAFDNMSPDSSKGVNLVLTRILSNTNDDLSYDNDVEIVKGTKTKGRRILVQVGKYMQETPGGIGSSSETITITPPTGDNQNYTIYIIIGVTSLIILAAGIVIIKKKVLK